jgi:raffinose/stachyose/melibiose transport system substrate-binding protein
MKRKLSVLLLCLVLVGTVCTGSIFGAAKISGKIVFSSNRTDFANTVIPGIVKKFNKIYPDVKVEIETIQQYQDAIRIKMAANDLPDVWTVHNNYYSKEQLQQFCVAADDFPFAKGFLCTDGFKGVDGKVYALPTGMGVNGIVYNKKLFAKLGIKVPQTLDGLIAAGKKLTAAGYVGIASSAQAGWPLQYYWQDLPKLISNDSAIRNKLAEQDEPFTKDNAVYKSYALLKRLNDERILEKDPLSSNWEPMKTDFRAGKIGMAYLGNWFVPQVIGKDSTLTMKDVGFFPFPYDNSKGPKNAIFGPDVALAVAKNSKNLPAAKAFFNFMMTTEYADYATACGLLSANPKVKVNLPFASEFMSYKPTVLPDVGDSQAQQDLQKKAQFDYNAFAQEILTGKSLDTAFTELNAKWKKAREAK